MRLTRLGVALGALLTLAAAQPQPQPDPEPGLEHCLQRDSISCVQQHVFRTLRSLFAQERLELAPGLALVRDLPSASALEDEQAGRAMATAADVERREAALEEFAVRKVQRFLEERSIKLDLSPLVKDLAGRARAVIATIPPEVRQRVVDFAVEGRGKKKKLKEIMPYLLLGGVKVAGLIGITYLAIALLAKKAILASLVSIAISGFIGLKKLLSQQHHGHHEVHEAIPVHGWSGGGGGGGGGGYSGGGASFDVSGYSGGHSEYGSHSSPVGHAIAYNAHKPGSR